ncbi:D-alanyl-D-alanine carboxypeptidase [Saccharopolyspora antimicrobica]|uniref:D-alanyl-D-alanine carboxypeptidase n=1 Tax=Saccharopolyspora antimicrobica TaxID=455193 RepID=A0A1I5HJE1_9PSEU|nr:serine hydrolase domain-containing protein [Saccharopolyspora antimicrobica]RKT85280.1 D-alanyl-D-alanine carboxypeptidase [Saccharopolyspora antimicrobica]SFO47971.1 D-alanyl-D-alanine carboxypeptidase [Saccharopolyspora antimicrobica]
MKRTLLAGMAAATLLTGGAIVPAIASTGDRTAIQQSLDGLVRDEEFPAALATTGVGNRARSYVAGTAELGGRKPPPLDGRVRAGSNTKAFVAVVVLQLVAEGKVGLDSPIEDYLPGLVRGEGVDGRQITVRQLLQHTSGLPNYTAHLGIDDLEALRDRYMQPRELLDIALAHPASFPPGERWEYSNTNYVLAGLLIERVTGRPVSEQVTDRVIRPIGLRDTYWPGIGDRTVQGPHPRGYAATADGQVVDATEIDPGWAWAAGALISTNGDLNEFYSALLGGKLLPAEQLAQMRTTVPADLWDGGEYGLGLAKTPLSCGGEYWGHGGDIFGYETRGGVTDDGRSAAVAVTAMPGTADEDNAERNFRAVLAAVDTALCEGR